MEGSKRSPELPRPVSALRSGSVADSADFACIFPTDIGWMGIVGQVNVVRSVVIGHSSAAAAKKSLKSSTSGNLKEADWFPELRQALEDYARGKRVNFDQFDLVLPDHTPFRDKVLAATRQLAYGQTTTYGDLARIVGHPRAARAVGTVMSTNRFPIIIPCHRVLASGGKLGGYSSPSGTCMKEVLLDLEQAAWR